ncbi:MAG: class I SAM-dependent methyltransferase [Ruegeria sp.]
MNDKVTQHYRGDGNLANRIAEDLRNNGHEPSNLSAADFEALDEFHFRGRQATLELISRMNLTPSSYVLDIGSGLGGVARTIAETIGCRVTGIDLTPEFCETATAISKWVGLTNNTEFRQGDATNIPFPDGAFDAAITVHVAMNIPDKAKMYQEARRVLKPGSIFVVYDILQGEGGPMYFPAPWAQDPSISHLATPDEMESLLTNAGFKFLHAIDSTDDSLSWLQERVAAPAQSGPLPVTTRLLFRNISLDMTRNQLRGLSERRMLTYGFVCQT